jgi:hypothetical protein
VWRACNLIVLAGNETDTFIVIKVFVNLHETNIRYFLKISSFPYTLSNVISIALSLIYITIARL